MAFSTTNVRAGVMGNLKLIAGDWSGADGDANGVFPKQIGRTYVSNFISEDSSNGPISAINATLAVSSTNTGAVNLGVANRRTTTTGRFLIICS